MKTRSHDPNFHGLRGFGRPRARPKRRFLYLENPVVKTDISRYYYWRDPASSAPEGREVPAFRQSGDILPGALRKLLRDAANRAGRIRQPRAAAGGYRRDGRALR